MKTTGMNVFLPTVLLTEQDERVENYHKIYNASHEKYSARKPECL